MLHADLPDHAAVLLPHLSSEEGAFRGSRLARGWHGVAHRHGPLVRLGGCKQVKKKGLEQESILVHYYLLIFKNVYLNEHFLFIRHTSTAFYPFLLRDGITKEIFVWQCLYNIRSITCISASAFIYLWWCHNYRGFFFVASRDYSSKGKNNNNLIITIFTFTGSHHSLRGLVRRGGAQGPHQGRG